jgi:hypothetical protein
VVGVVFIATNHFVAVAPFCQPRTVRPCRSTAENATVSSNGYIAFNASSDVRQRQSRLVRSCTPDGPRGRYNLFIEPVTFGFFGSFPTGRSAPEAGRSVRSLGWCLLFHRTVRSRDICFCIGSVRGLFRCRERSAAKARTIRAWPDFPKSFSCPE